MPQPYDVPFAIAKILSNKRYPDDSIVPWEFDVSRMPGAEKQGDDWYVNGIRVAKENSDSWQYYLETTAQQSEWALAEEEVPKGITTGGSPVIATGSLNPTGGLASITHPAMADARLVQVFADVVLAGSNLAAGETAWEPRGSSNNASSINNGAVDDLSYNNRGGSSVGWTIGIDFGAPTTVDTVSLYDWTNASYIATEFEVVNSTDGSEINVVASVTGHTHSPDPTPATISFEAETARYWGVRSVVTSNSSYWVLSELELFLSPPLVSRLLTPGVDYNADVASPTETRVSDVAGSNLKYVIVGDPV